jgi:hypothetical protein
VCGAIGALGVLAAAFAVSSTQSSATTPPPAQRPLALSGYAAQLSPESATIDAGVNPRGSDTTYLFQYGPTTAYGAQTQPMPAGAGTVEVKVTQALTGLTPNTAYHFRMVATSSAGVAEGPDRSFTTKAAPIALTASVAPNPDVFGDPFAVTGRLTGGRGGSQQIVLQADPFPYTQGFTDLGTPSLTDAYGDFAVQAPALAVTSHVRVAALGPPVAYSPVLLERVAVRVTFHVRRTARAGFYLLYGAVTPAMPGARVGFQRLRAHGRPATVSASTVRRARNRTSEFARVLRIRHKGLYRAYVWLRSGELVSNHSRSVRIR